ncbi:hypothetical protein JL101_025290 [Skermanella rosea]|uniref:hypothetical protein n=1 Tax=Skermanella rosea TaxID=1817965 RepID=UPI001931A3CA|nr:hypothetical protein [Skermanella rosea]UEM03245.1 hypothetical protein JL101_025290 [Skermanella rosea]
MSDAVPDLIDQCLADLTAKRNRLDAAMNAAAAIGSEYHTALLESYVEVVHRIQRDQGGNSPDGRPA